LEDGANLAPEPIISDTDYFINRKLNPGLTPDEQQQEIERNLDYDQSFKIH